MASRKSTYETVIAKNVRRYRELAGLSLKELSGLTGISIARLSRIESDGGQPSNLNISRVTIVTIALALKIEPFRLLMTNSERSKYLPKNTI